ncbi:AzlD domain-containing protein [Rathayibacter sp. YIM 133350]|uniref:AzlD domain-containing protein n=1 Tax=Rathayibacter sp. YIM 133350 TaxID=3131992 RepID=UPI00307D9748
MTMWQIVILASMACVAIKLGGYLVPPRVLHPPTPSRIADMLTVALLAGLTAVQSFASGHDIVLDARVPALIVAAALYALRVPFVVVVLVAAALAAGIRLLV